MKKFRILFLMSIFIMCFVGNAFSEISPNQQNIDIVQSLEFGKKYKFPNYFGLIDADIKIVNKHKAWVYCNNNKLQVAQSDTGTINTIIIREPSITLYGMEIQKTLWNDPLVENPYFIRREISPNGKTIFVYYQSENRNMQYVAFFFSDQYAKSPKLLQIEKRFIGDPC